MGFELTPRDLARLEGVHPDLVRVIKRAARDAPDGQQFVVLEGRRSVTRQAELVRQGASQTMASRHITGHAVDIAPYLDTDGDGDKEPSWHWPHYHRLAAVVKAAARSEAVQIEWGGDWLHWKDGPHWQLPRVAYPA